MFQPPSVGTHVQGKHLEKCTCMCALLNFTNRTPLLPHWTGPEDAILLSIISPHWVSPTTKTTRTMLTVIQITLAWARSVHRTASKHKLRLVSMVLDSRAVWFLPPLELKVGNFCDATNARKMFDFWELGLTWASERFQHWAENECSLDLYHKIDWRQTNGV